MSLIEIWKQPGMGLIIFLLGACLGSFFNVCIDRMSAGKSIISPGSHCVCGEKIPFYLNIPILSWLLLRGRARCCGAPIGWQSLFTEVFTAVILSLLWKNSDPWLFGFTLIFFSILIVASGIDFRTMEIPDKFTVGGACIGVFCSVIFAHYSSDNFIFIGALSSLKGMLIGSSLLMWMAIFSEIILKKEAIGFGDVKLMGCIGAFSGTKGAIFSIFGGACIGVLTILPFWWLQNRSKGFKMGMGVPLPFGPFLSVGAIAYWLFFKGSVDGALGLLELLVR